MNPNKVIVMQKEVESLNVQLKDKRQKLKKTIDRLDKLSSNLTLTQQQIDLFASETQMSLERVKDANWEFTKEMAKQVGNIANPDQNLQEVANKFLVTLDQKDRSWEVFINLVKNQSPLKALMNNFSSEQLSEETLQTLMPIWKNQTTLQNKLKNTHPGMAIILKWICTNVELKLKRETLKSQQRKIPELQKKVKEQLSRISDDNSEVQRLQEGITAKKNELEAIKHSQPHSNLPQTNHQTPTELGQSNSNQLELDFQDTKMPFHSLIHLREEQRNKEREQSIKDDNNQDNNSIHSGREQNYNSGNSIVKEGNLNLNLNIPKADHLFKSNQYRDQESSDSNFNDSHKSKSNASLKDVNTNSNNEKVVDQTNELARLNAKQKELEGQIRKLAMKERHEEEEEEDINIGSLVRVDDSPTDNQGFDIKMENEENNFCCKGRFCF